MKLMIQIVLVSLILCFSGCGESKNDESVNTNSLRRLTPSPGPTPPPSPSPSPSGKDYETPSLRDEKHGGSHGGHDEPEAPKVRCECYCEGKLLWSKELTDAECKRQCPKGSRVVNNLGHLLHIAS